MASSCISSCVDDARVPVRASYVNLYKWPESDAEFIRSMSSNVVRKSGGHPQPRPKVVDSISCRQMYLRSYTFSREDDHHHKMEDENTKCLGRIRSNLRNSTRWKRHSRGGGGGGRRGGRRKCWRLKKVKEVSCAALVSIFRKLLFCTTKVDVVE